MSRRSSIAQSQAASIAAPSPAIVPAVPVTNPAPAQAPVPIPPAPIEASKVEEARKTSTPAPRMPAAPPGLEHVREQTPRIFEQVLPPRPTSPTMARIRKLFVTGDMKFVFDTEQYENNRETLHFIDSFPPLFDLNSGARRQILRRRELERSRLEHDRQVASQVLSAINPDEHAEGGSYQLGGEPEEPLDPDAIQPPLQGAIGNSFGNDSLRQLSAQEQQQQLLLQQLKSASPNPAGGLGASNSGHTRQASRFSFANDSTASASVKPVANQKLMNQQSSMMPPQQVTQYGAFPQQQSSSLAGFSSGVPGPPPGLKNSGTPAVSGGGMFGQGHGFGSAGLGYGVNANGRTANDEMMRELLRNRGNSTGGDGPSDIPRGEYLHHSRSHHLMLTLFAGDLSDPSILQARMRQTAGAQTAYGAQGQGNLNSVYGHNGYGRW
jgi:CCR4-NOT transcription complex subunit 4